MDIKQRIIDQLESRKGLSHECDEFIQDAVLAVEQTEEEIIAEFCDKLTVEKCISKCLLRQEWITLKYSKLFIYKSSALLASTPFNFLA